MPTAAAWMILLSCLGVGLAGFAAFGLHSYHPTDQGFLLGLGWRVHGGQIPYRDFVYIRPPGTLYLHSLWFALPEGWALPAARLGFYLQMALSAALPALAALRAGLVRSPATLAALSAGFLAVALHNFPAMPWHTVDGVFFSSVGLSAWLMSLVDSPRRSALRWRVIASLGFATALLCKQNFLFPALLFGVGSALEWIRSPASRAPDRHAFLLASALPGLLLGGLVAGGLWCAGALPGLVAQITTGSGLIEAGFWNYVLYWPWWAVLPGLAWPWLCRRLESSAVPPALRAGLVVLSPLGFLTLLLLSDKPADLGRLLLWFLLGTLATRAFGWLREHDEQRRTEQGLRLVLAGGVFTIAWSASISWGYPSPSLGLAAMGVAIVDLIPRVERRWLAPAAAGVSAAILLAHAARLNLDSPYRDVRRSQQVAALHEVFPRFGRLWSNPSLAAHYRELDRLIERHALDAGRDFVVLRDFPLIHYLADRQSPARLDWYFHAETQGRGRELLRELLQLDAVFLLYKKRNVSPIGWDAGFDKPCSPDTFAHSPMLSRPILKAGRLLDEGRYFCVVSLEGERPGLP
jgi:hypothetical protein